MLSNQTHALLQLVAKRTTLVQPEIIIKGLFIAPIYHTRCECRCLHTHTHTHTHTVGRGRKGTCTAVKKSFKKVAEQVSFFQRWRRHRVAECLRQAVPNRLASVRDHRRYLSTICLCCSHVSVFRKSSKLTTIFTFIAYLIVKLCSRSSLILSTLNSLQLLQTNLRHLNMKMSQRHSIKACDGNHGAWKRKLTFYIFASMKLRDSAMKIHQKLDSVYGTPCSHDTVSTRPERPQRWATPTV